jgi:hypothetical protein
VIGGSVRLHAASDTDWRLLLFRHGDPGSDTRMVCRRRGCGRMAFGAWGSEGSGAQPLAARCNRGGPPTPMYVIVAHFAGIVSGAVRWARSSSTMAARVHFLTVRLSDSSQGAFHLTDDCGPLSTSSSVALASLRMASIVEKTFSATPSSRPPLLCLPPAFRQEGRRRERLPHSVGRSPGWPPAQRSSRRPCARR